MGERKGTNKYYPPDFDPEKHKSLAGYTGQHPLRERARKIKQGILVIRFEMPYNIWCDGCKNHIGMGVRYNAEKSKVGNYYTTPIYQFRMKCHLCDNYMVIKTDPAAHDYVIVSGARRKEQRWDPKENEQIVPEDKDTQKKLFQDAMYRLEHGSEDTQKMKNALPAIAQIEQHQSQHRDDYMLNKLARQKFREEKKSLKQLAESDTALLKKSSLDIELVAEHEDDKRLAELLKYSTVKSFDVKLEEKRKEIESRPLFAVSSPPPSDSPLNAKQTQLLGLRKKIGDAKSSSKPSPFSGATSPASTAKQDFGVIRKPKSTKPAHSLDCDNLPSSPSIALTDDCSNLSPSVTDSAISKPVHALNNSIRVMDSKSQKNLHNDKLRTESSGPCNALSSLFSNYDSSSNSGSDTGE